MIHFRLADSLDMPEAISTFVVFEGDNAIGRVTAMGSTDWRITYAGLGVNNFHRGQRHLSRNEATRALLDHRAASSALRTTPSGLTGLQEDVLLAEKEIGPNATSDARQRAAAKLAISPTNYLQILFRTVDTDLAEEFLPLTVRRLREERAVQLARRGRTARPLAAAS